MDFVGFLVFVDFGVLACCVVCLEVLLVESSEFGIFVLSSFVFFKILVFMDLAFLGGFCFSRQISKSKKPQKNK